MARKYTFLDKEDSPGGTGSLVFAIIAWILTIADAAISVLSEGNAGAFAGAIGLGAFLFGVCAFFTALPGIGKRNVSHTKAYIGMIGGGLVMILWLALMIRALKII